MLQDQLPWPGLSGLTGSPGLVILFEACRLRHQRSASIPAPANAALHRLALPSVPPRMPRLFLSPNMTTSEISLRCKAPRMCTDTLGEVETASGEEAHNLGHKLPDAAASTGVGSLSASPPPRRQWPFGPALAPEQGEQDRSEIPEGPPSLFFLPDSRSEAGCELAWLN